MFYIRQSIRQYWHGIGALILTGLQYSKQVKNVHNYLLITAMRILRKAKLTISFCYIDRSFDSLDVSRLSLGEIIV